MVEALPEPSERELTSIVDLVYQKSGIVLHEGKRALIMARLQRRVRAGGFGSFAGYLAHVRADRTGSALAGLIDAIATNHTSFFREVEHFQFLRDRIVPALAARPLPIRAWSAACATGEEPYSIAITLLDSLPESRHGSVSILASDLSGKALQAARAAVFATTRVSELPRPVLQKHFERGVDAQEGLVRVAAATRSRVQFRQLNLLEIERIGPFDFIFCRNVMIYFDRAGRQRVVSMLERNVAPGGYCFVSHSESLTGLTHSLRWVAPSVYQRVTA
ncbi:MAG TPA: CheR family methyltransferase [Vicinamibacterales bacterium]|nr:CheR family methyltransferase [Vicinamibacterales bacterium]